MLIGATLLDDGVINHEQSASDTALIDGGFMSLAVSNWDDPYGD